MQGSSSANVAPQIFQCDQCDRRYTKKQSLRRHKRDVHKDRIRPPAKETQVVDNKINGINNMNNCSFGLNTLNYNKSPADDLASIDQIQNTFNTFNNPVKVLDDNEMNRLVRTLSADSMNAVFMTELDGPQFD